jgi:hypothetical protein
MVDYLAKIRNLEEPEARSQKSEVRIKTLKLTYQLSVISLNLKLALVADLLQGLVLRVAGNITGDIRAKGDHF